MDHPPPITCRRDGFTIIELSIVLVIIGLLAGGILLGRDLIEAARIRAQGSQIESYEMAINTFRLKYNMLPGDLTSTQASMLGFQRAAQPANPAREGTATSMPVAAEPVDRSTLLFPLAVRIFCSGATCRRHN